MLTEKMSYFVLEYGLNGAQVLKFLNRGDIHVIYIFHLILTYLMHFFY